MSTSTLPDEQPSQKRAKRLITQKRLYFLPEHGRSVKASEAKDAVAEVTKQATVTTTTTEEGDVK